MSHFNTSLFQLLEAGENYFKLHFFYLFYLFICYYYFFSTSQSSSLTHYSHYPRSIYVKEKLHLILLCVVLAAENEQSH